MKLLYGCIVSSGSIGGTGGGGSKIFAPIHTASRQANKVLFFIIIRPFFGIIGWLPVCSMIHTLLLYRLQFNVKRDRSLLKIHGRGCRKTGISAKQDMLRPAGFSYPV